MATSQSPIDVRRYEYIDVLRAVAILGVMSVHCQQHVRNLSTLAAALCNYGQMGVQLFFIASALTLCLSADARQEGGPFNFYLRRFFRIAPLYYFGIAFYFMWRLVLMRWRYGSFFIIDGYHLLAVVENVLFLHGFHPSNFNFVVPGGWSIATEMAFYATFPLLFRALTRLSLRAFIGLSIVVAALSLAAQYLAIEILQPILAARGILKTAIPDNDEFNFIYASLINQINVFMVGLVAYKMLKKRVRSAQLLLAAGLVAAACFMQNDHRFDTGYDGFFYPTLSGIAFAIVAVRLSSARLPSNSAFRLLVHVGQNSFSMYLMHFAVLDVVEIALSRTVFKAVEFPEARLAMLYAVVAVATYFVARQTNRAIEKPGIRLGKRLLSRAALKPAGESAPL